MAHRPAATTGRPGPRPDRTGVTFTWAGTGPPPVVAGAWCGWDPDQALEMRRSGNGWEVHLDLPKDAYVEYAFFRGEQRVPDPTNPHRVSNGLGDWNHRIWMPDASRRASELVRRRVPRGELVRGSVDLGFMAPTRRRRRLDCYRPPSGRARDLPLLVVLDGPDYLGRGRLPRLIDALVAERSMAPVAAAFIASGGPARSIEYTASDVTAMALARVVVPAARERLGLGAGPVAILGSSMGGLMALHAGLRVPDVFGRVIAQSSWLGEGLLVRGDLTLVDWVRHAPAAPTRIWMDVGLETLAASNDRVAALLRDRGYEVTYRRLSGGHDQTSWAEGLAKALPEAFPPG